jgi:hypothetical protein
VKGTVGLASAFLCKASSDLHYFRGIPLSCKHAWVRACSDAFATDHYVLLSHVSPAVSFPSSSPIIKIRIVSKRKLKTSNRYQLPIRRDEFPNKFHQG